jgi:hypothetical protein
VLASAGERVASHATLAALFPVGCLVGGRVRKPKKPAPPAGAKNWAARASRRRMRLAPAGPCPQREDYRTDKGYSRDILAWAFRLWPFNPDTEPLDLFRLPRALVEAFPPNPDSETFGAIAEAVQQERRDIRAGRNEEFERVAGHLFGAIKADRGELIRRSSVEVPVLEWILAQSRAVVSSRRSAVTPLRKAYRQALRAALRKWPDFTPAAAVEIDLVYRYLAGVPTMHELRRWRRVNGINRRSTVWGLHVWTAAASDLVEYLRPLKRAADPDTSALASVSFAEAATAELLLARYPAVMPTPDLAKLTRLIRLRINRAT